MSRPKYGLIQTFFYFISRLKLENKEKYGDLVSLTRKFSAVMDKVSSFLKRAEKTVTSNKLLWTIFHALSELFRYILINRKVNWNPEPVPIENEKAEVIKKTKETIKFIMKKNVD